MGPNLEVIIIIKLKENIYRKIQVTMITNIELKDNNIIPLSRTTENNKEIFIPVKIV